MALWWRRHMNDIRSDFRKHLRKITERSLNAKSFAELLRHQRFGVATCDDFAFTNTPDLRSMRIGDFAATYDGDFKRFHSSVRQASKYRRNPSEVGTDGVQPRRSFSF